MSQRKIKERRKKSEVQESYIFQTFFDNLLFFFNNQIKPYTNRYLQWGVYLVVFLYSVYPQLDRDWGWHYKYGEYFFINGSLLLDDVFSSTLPGYEWVNHSWAYDIILYKLQNIVGFAGLSFFGAIFVFLSFFIMTRRYVLSPWKLGAAAFFFISITQIGVEQGLRSQVVSLSFYAILLSILDSSRSKVTRLWFLAPLFFVWVNLHADYVLGLLIAVAYLSIYSITLYLEKGGDFYEIGRSRFTYLIPAFAATFINPFTYHIYTETPRHLMNDYLRNVLEWGPLYDGCSTCNTQIFLLYCFLIGLISSFAIYKKKWEYLPYIFFAVVLFWQTYHTRRYAPIYVTVTLPILLIFLESWKTKLETFKILPYTTLIIIILLSQYIVFTRFKDLRVLSFTINDYCALTGCSTGIIDYVKENPPKGKGFNFYDWGGYLIGMDFPAKLFIDGRMHVWSDKNGYQPFADYIEMYYNENIELFNRYNFDWLLIPNDSFIAQRLMTTSDLGVWRLDFQEGETNYYVRVRE